MSVDANSQSSPTPAYSDWIAPRIEELGLQGHLRAIEAQGYTVLENVVPRELNERIRNAIIRCAQETLGAGKGRTASLLLGRDPVFEEAVLLPEVFTLMQCLLGRGFLLSQLIGSIRGKGAPTLPVHADNNWLPAPFPEWETLLTACWALDDFTLAGGPTKVIPGTHALRRHPSPDELLAEDGAIPIECSAGSIVLWNGSIWHGNYARTIEGDRVTLHQTCTRLSFRPVEDYGQLGDDWLTGRAPEVATLLGRDDFLQHRRLAEGFADPTKLAPVFASVQAKKNIPRRR